MALSREVREAVPIVELEEAAAREWVEAECQGDAEALDELWDSDTGRSRSPTS